MGRLRVGVIVDNMRLARWQADALRTLAANHDFIVYNCLNTRPARRRARHALYYLLNLVAIRNRLTRRVPITSEFVVAANMDFESTYEGNWQHLPASLLAKILADRPLVLVKFGMGLLRVPPVNDLPFPILSYHHGDPRNFRGRPAGFYELLHESDRMGQVVQLLSNDLDSGAIAAFAETKVHRHSYRATLLEAYRASPLLLRKAITETLAKNTRTFPKGKAYRLPSNVLVTRFCLARLRHSLARLWYGAFVEKRWHVAEASATGGTWIERIRAFPAKDHWTIVPTPPGYSFIADPFPHPAGGILVEGLATPTGRGSILHLRDGASHQLTSFGDHWSYPATITVQGEDFVVPEISEWDRVRLFRLDPGGLQDVPEFAVQGMPRLIDPTLTRHGDAFYLFANRFEEGSGILRLWVGESLKDLFREHPQSPIRISPAGSRMGGAIVTDGVSLFRIGQDFSGPYGDGILVFEIETLSRTDYCETERCRLRFAGVRGPHTLNGHADRMLFDFYRDAVSTFAGLRRLRARLVAYRRQFGAPGPTRTDTPVKELDFESSASTIPPQGHAPG